jgi:hypothetical protein
MPLWFPRNSFHGGRTIDAFSLNAIPIDGVQPNDPTAVRFRSIAEILLRGVQRCVAADRELMDEPDQTSNAHEPVFDNLEDSLPEPLAFVSDKPLTVSHVSKTLGFGNVQDTQRGGNS